MDHIKLALLLLLAVSGMLHETTACGRGRRCPPRDRDPPVFSHCPGNIHEIAEPIQENAKVYWNEPTAYDNWERRSVRVHRSGRGPGTLFSERWSPYTIRYTARDRSGNSAYCNVRIHVTVVRCNPIPSPTDGWKICHPGVSSRSRYGSVCRFGCYTGHELRGAASAKCRDDKRWSAQTPYCDKLTCNAGIMYPSAGQIDIVSISCTDSNKYRSKCTFSCIDGYSVGPGQSKVLVCGASRSWVGTVPVCVDSRAPEFTDCPAVVTGYAERTKTTGRNYWIDPQATDNSGHVTVEQTDGYLSGTELPVGEYDIEYTATDPSGNSAICEFKLIIKQIQCPEIFPLPYTSVTCSSGRIFGARCNFACASGTASSTSLETYCDRNDDGTYHFGFWDFGHDQPYCTRENPCDPLEPPANGALACDTWEAGRYCRMLCQNGYTVYESPGYAVHDGMLICGNSGEWRISGVIPDCVEEIARAGGQVEVRFGYYYDGVCQDAIEEIRQIFVDNFLDWTGSCNPPDCSVDNVQVICGTTTKRGTEKPLTVVVRLLLPGDSNYGDDVAIRDAIKRDLVAVSGRGDLDIALGGQTLAATPPEVSQVGVVCPVGSVPGTVKQTCVQCGPGTYQDSTAEPSVCRKCPIGQYQTDFGQTSCVPCMTGTTTENLGSSRSTDCKEACPKGQASPRGTTPCSLCDLGTYADGRGARECRLCPGSKTTNTTGSTSVNACYDFDVVFTSMAEDEPVAPSVIADMTSVEEFRLTMWVRCTVCVDLLDITADTGDAILVLSGGTETLETTVGSTSLPAATLALNSSSWHHLRVDWSQQSVEVYVDDGMVSSGSHTVTLPGQLHVAFGGPNFLGRVSQLGISSSVTAGTSGAGDTCVTQDGGVEDDLLSWRQYVDLDGPFVQTRSKCDAFDNCVSEPCQNAGVCSDAIDGFTCACAIGFTGSDCSTNIDDCEGSVCDNDGTCVDGDDIYTCACSHGFTGEYCEIEVVDGAWGAWGNWSDCNATCGTGYEERSRTCENPEPSNGGATCPGHDNDVRVCHEEPCVFGCDTDARECHEGPCVFECDVDPQEIEHGSLNCAWEDEDQTSRRCDPECDPGYDWDSDRNVVPPNVFCGPNTGGTWNIRSDENSELLLPSCLVKTPGKSNILEYTGQYDLETADDAAKTAIQDILKEKARQTECVGTLGRCTVQSVDVEEEEGDRRRRATSFVTFTLTIKCDINTDINECYDLLATVVQELDSLVSTQGYTVNVNGGNYDVIVNSTSLDGTTACDAGYVPVFHYCIPCGTGMYQSGDFCERCGFGFYQDEIAQSSCTQCPEGWTTQNLMTRNGSLCNVAAPEEDIDALSIVVIVCAVVATVAVIVLAVIIIVVYKKIKKIPVKDTTPIEVLNAGAHADFNHRVRFDGSSHPYNLFTVPTPTPLYGPKDKATLGVEETEMDAIKLPEGNNTNRDASDKDKDKAQYDNPLYDSD